MNYYDWKARAAAAKSALAIILMIAGTTGAAGAGMSGRPFLSVAAALAAAVCLWLAKVQFHAWDRYSSKAMWFRLNRSTEWRG